jgi:DNA-directed RNA polymerase alpha subunit
MLEEFKERIELFFNKPFNSVLETEVIEEIEEKVEENPQETESDSDITDDDLSILDIDLSIRAINAIYANYEMFLPDNTVVRNIRGIKLKHFKYITKRQLAKFRNIGAKTVHEIEEKLLEHGIEMPKQKIYFNNK